LSNSKFAQFVNTRYHNPHREPEMSAANIVSTRNEIKNYGNRNALRWQNIDMVLLEKISQLFQKYGELKLLTFPYF